MKRPVIYIRATPEQHARIAAAANADGMPVTTWIRTMLGDTLGVAGNEGFGRRRNSYPTLDTSRVIYVRTEAPLHDAAKRAAEREGQTLSQWVLEMALRESGRHTRRASKARANPA